ALEDDRSLLALERQVGDEELVDPVVVPRIVRRRLVVPHDLARVGVEGDGRRRVQVREVPVVALVGPAHGGIPGARIARAVKDEVLLRIVRSKRPGGPAARLPRVTLPGVVAGLPGSRDEVGPPYQRPAVRLRRLQGAGHPGPASAAPPSARRPRRRAWGRTTR